MAQFPAEAPPVSLSLHDHHDPLITYLRCIYKTLAPLLFPCAALRSPLGFSLCAALPFSSCSRRQDSSSATSVQVLCAASTLPYLLHSSVSLSRRVHCTGCSPCCLVSTSSTRNRNAARSWSPRRTSARLQVYAAGFPTSNIPSRSAVRLICSDLLHVVLCAQDRNRCSSRRPSLGSERRLQNPVASSGPAPPSSSPARLHPLRLLPRSTERTEKSRTEEQTRLLISGPKFVVYDPSRW